MPAVGGFVFDSAGVRVDREIRVYRRDTGALLGKTRSSGGGGDPHYDKVSLLLHMNGVDGSTMFSDSSVAPKTVTAYGGAKISTTQSKFGVASAYFDGVGDYLEIPYKTSEFRWWDSKFTLEVLVFPVALSTFSFVNGLYAFPNLIGNSSSVDITNYWSFGPGSDGRVLFTYWSGVTNNVYSAATIAENQWSHIALVVNDGKITIYVNGVGSTPVAIAGTPQDTQTLPLLVGAAKSSYINGYIDELRITKGVARYTADFTPPTAQFPDAQNPLAFGEYRFTTNHTGEVQVVCLDDDSAPLENDLILRTFPV